MECKFPTMMDNSWNNFLAVNTDSVMKDEPGSYLASVDASSSPLALIIPRYFLKKVIPRGGEIIIPPKRARIQNMWPLAF